jgi:anti-anti-sigma factor
MGAFQVYLVNPIDVSFIPLGENMPVDSQIIDGQCVCRVSGALNIWEAAVIWGHMFPLLATCEPLSVDLSEVDACDGAGIQIICQIQRARGAGKPIALTGASHVVIDAMALAGLDVERFFTTVEEA